MVKLHPVTNRVLYTGQVTALRFVDLAGADLRWAYLSGAYLAGADLTGAYLRGAYLRGAYLSQKNQKKLQSKNCGYT